MLDPQSAPYIYSITGLVVGFAIASLPHWLGRGRRARKQHQGRAPVPSASPIRYICVGGRTAQGSIVFASALPVCYGVPSEECVAVPWSENPLDTALYIAHKRRSHPDAMVLRVRDLDDYTHHLEARRLGAGAPIITMAPVQPARIGHGWQRVVDEPAGREHDWCRNPMCPVCAARSVAGEVRP